MKRRDLMRLAPAMAAATAVGMAAPIAAAETPAELPLLTENPNLLKLGDELPKVEQAYQNALQAWRDAWAKWSPQWPLAPEVCCNKYGARGHNRELERDLRGAALQREGEECTWYIKTAEEMEREIESAREALAKDDKRKRSWGKAFRQYRYQEIADAELGLILLPGYLAERERVQRESNFAAIHKARSETCDALFSVTRNILQHQSLTMEGVKIKARACAAVGRMPTYDQAWGQMKDNTAHEDCMAGLLGKAMLEVLHA